MRNKLSILLVLGVLLSLNLFGQTKTVKSIPTSSVNYLPMFASDSTIKNSNLYYGSGGSIGINTSNPSNKFEVWSSGNLVRLNRTNNLGATITLSRNDSNKWVLSGGLSSYKDEYSINGSDGSSKFSILQNGNVGIGTITPSAPLHVKQNSILGDALNSNIKIATLNSKGGSGGNEFYITDFLVRDQAITNGTWTTARFHNGISIDGSYDTPNGASGSGAGSGTRSWWERDPYDGIQSWGDQNSTWMTLKTGKLGIGTTSPASIFSIKATSNYINSNASYLAFPSTSETFAFYGNTEQPVMNLITNLDTDGAKMGGVWWTRQAGQSDAHRQVAGIYAMQNGTGILASADIGFATKQTGGSYDFSPRMIIKAGGYVGIGITTPAYKLHVGNGNGQIAIGTTFMDNPSNVNTGWTRGAFSSNLFWDNPNNIWKANNTLIGANDFTSMQHLNGGVLAFYTAASTGNTVVSITGANLAGYERMRITNDGKVGIGTTNPGSFKLAVEGKIGAREVVVTTDTPWPDYVFSENHKLTSLEETEQYIKENKHLPEIPSAAEVKENGVAVGEMQAKLLQKIEELTLHMIAQEKRINKLEVENKKLKEEKK